MACLGQKTKAKKKNLKTYSDYFLWVDSVNILIKFFYDREKVEQKPAIYSFKQLHKEIVAKDIRLSSFFNSIYNAIFLDKKNEKYLDKLDKRLVVECYIICSNQNSKLIVFKEDIFLFLDLMRTEIANSYSSLIESYLENNKYNALALNVDNYHNIHAKWIPNTCSTLTMAYMTTLLLNRINIIAILRMILNNASIHNPKLIDFKLICNILDYYYMDQIAKTFNNQFYYETSLDEKVKNLTLQL
ncbi:23459_t:CDS:2 [Gigaspora margarita]|uniref:23459_t:CDS:1 n=1 Tax=Gigaspora margarita TaxID=4874 RepID=A0ABN7USY4_GIGMA|nr:23459_t:CDS:2 [Gigaspora margarita]